MCHPAAGQNTFHPTATVAAPASYATSITNPSTRLLLAWMYAALWANSSRRRRVKNCKLWQKQFAHTHTIGFRKRRNNNCSRSHTYTGAFVHTALFCFRGWTMDALFRLGCTWSPPEDGEKRGVGVKTMSRPTSVMGGSTNVFVIVTAGWGVKRWWGGGKLNAPTSRQAVWTIFFWFVMHRYNNMENLMFSFE